MSAVQELQLVLTKQNEEAFKAIRDCIVAELNGTATPDMIVTQLDSLSMPTDSTALLKADSAKLATQANYKK